MQATSDHLRSELAFFLKAKRKQLQPTDFGLPVTTKRRTAGLRREEVAELAQVGPTWYTWLEQGRDIRASIRVLHNIAGVLHLNDVETRHLLSLAGHAESAHAIDTEDDGTTGPPLQAVVDAIRAPAFVRNSRYDVLAWNDSFAALFGFRQSDPPIERNLLWRLFANTWDTIELPRWQELAKQLTADFRMAYARHGNSAAFRSLITDLCAASPLFATWWDEFLIGDLHEIPQTILHPVLGTMDVNVHHFDVMGFNGVKLVLFAFAP